MSDNADEGDYESWIREVDGNKENLERERKEISLNLLLNIWCWTYIFSVMVIFFIPSRALEDSDNEIDNGKWCEDVVMSNNEFSCLLFIRIWYLFGCQM